MTTRQKARRPRIVGIGGTARVGSSTEAALASSLKRAETLGAGMLTGSLRIGPWPKSLRP